MRKGKKQRNLEEKKLDKTGKNSKDGMTEDSQKNNLIRQIGEVAAGLYYISETDAEIVPFAGERSASLSRETILFQTRSAPDSPVEERDFKDFFARLTEIQDWYGDEETETARKFLLLKELLEKNLRDLKVFKIGEIQIDIYVVGLDAKNNLLGIKTRAVET